MNPTLQLFVCWGLFWIAVGAFFWLRHRAEQKRIQTKRERYARIRELRSQK